MIAAPGLQCGFGEPLGLDLLNELRRRGYTIIRIDLQYCNQSKSKALCDEVIDAGLQPLCIINRPEQIDALHEGALIEVGNEPNLEHNGWTTVSYIETANACIEKALALGRRIYVGSISNLDHDGFSFLQKLPWYDWPAEVCCSIHRYPEGDDPHVPHRGWNSREDEVAYLKNIVGHRPLACTEVGYHDDTQTEADVAGKMAWERKFWGDQGFEICVAYQINDGPGTSGDQDNHEDFFGFRTIDGQWKPVAESFISGVVTPPSNVTTTLQASSGHFVCAESGGGREAVANRSGAGPWETWHVHQHDDGRISLQAHNGQFMTAELDGSIKIRAYQPNEWERFFYEIRDGDRIALLSSHDTYVQAPEGGGTDQSMRCVGNDVNLPGVWEFFTSSTKFWEKPITNQNLLHGPLKRNKRVIYDDSGPRITMGCHFMEGFSAYCHGKSVDGLTVEEQLDIIAEKYGIVRNLDVLGYWDCNRPGDTDEWSAWKGREVTPVAFVAYSGRRIPVTPDYWDRKREYVTMLHERGLRIFDDRGDMNSWTRQQKLDHMFQNGQFYNSLPFGREVLAGLFGINEAWQNGGDDRDLLIDMINSFKAGAGWLPAIVGLSAPGGNSDPAALAACKPPMTYWEAEMPESFEYWSADPATVLTIHGNRGAHEHIIEHYFGYGYDDQMRKTGKQPENTEPVGGGDGVSVGQVNDPELLCGLTMAAIAGGQGWIFMSGNGVFWNGPIHSMPGFNEVADLTTLIPQDVATWPVVCHAGTRFQGVRILAAVDPTRAEHYIAADGRFIIVVHTYGEPGNALPCERACSEFTVIDMMTGEIEREGPMAVGGHYQHDGTARLVVGKLTPQAAQQTMPAWEQMVKIRRAGRLDRIRRIAGEKGWTS